jgi:hypothetical protein
MIRSMKDFVEIMDQMDGWSFFITVTPVLR